MAVLGWIIIGLAFLILSILIFRMVALDNDRTDMKKGNDL